MWFSRDNQIHYLAASTAEALKKTCQSSQPTNLKATFVDVFWVFLADLLHPELYHKENIEDFSTT